MAKKRNKVKFGLSNVHWAKIIQWGEDSDGNKRYRHMANQ